MSTIGHPKDSQILLDLQTARRNYDFAAGECPHWDFANPQGSDLDCCQRMREAYQAKIQARTRFERSQLS